MYCVVLLLTLFATVVTSQTSQACMDVSEALAANQVCLSALLQVGQSLDNDAAINNEQLNNFCSPSCRALVNRFLTDCANEPDIDIGTIDTATLDLVCTTNDNGSCIELFTSPQFANVDNAFESSGQCESLTTNAQTCSTGCAMLLQDFIDFGGCCALEILEFGSQVNNLDITIDQLTSICSINAPQDTSCQVLGGGSGAKELKAYGGLLLFVVIMAAVF